MTILNKEFAIKKRSIGSDMRIRKNSADVDLRKTREYIVRTTKKIETNRT
jgi:hypothetical protein